MLSYKIIQHTPGRIKIEIPYIKSIPLSHLSKVAKRLSDISFPDGIESIKPNPFTGGVVIKYKPDKIDILQYINKLASSDEIYNLLKFSSEKRPDGISTT
ncbi:MAG: hypothetical protein N2511_03270 [Thermodesulfovibrionales bacterium]|nr:hypothetical protein [Thermodesulfovibrionales bacterium]